MSSLTLRVFQYFVASFLQRKLILAAAFCEISEIPAVHFTNLIADYSAQKQIETSIYCRLFRPP